LRPSFLKISSFLIQTKYQNSIFTIFIKNASNFCFGKKRYNGRTDWADWADTNGFFLPKCANFEQKNQKKSVLICPIRSIRSPIVSAFSKAEIAEKNAHDQMYKLIINKLRIFLPTFLAITLLSFWLREAAPTDPVDKSGSALSEEAYRHAAIQLHRDKPLFYFALTTQAFPDTLYRFLYKNRIAALTSKIRAFGNWGQIEAYYNMVLSLKNATQNQDDFIYLHNLFEKMLVNEHSTQEWCLLRQVEQKTNELGQFQEQVSALRQKYNYLNENPQVWQLYTPKLNWYGIDNQYHHWFFSTLCGDFGVSSVTGRSVLGTLYLPLKITLWVSLSAILSAFLIGIGFGTWLARAHKTTTAYFISNFLFIIYAFPPFLVAVLIRLLLTEGGFGQVGSVGLYVNEKDSFLTFLSENAFVLIFPTICVSYRLMTQVARHLQMGLLDELKKEYVRTARAKGMLKPNILYFQVFKNALLPLITLFGQTFPFAIAGSVTVEIIFNIHGMGLVAYDALMQQNHPVIYAIVTLSAMVAMMGSFVADVLQGYVNPQKSFK
jgi:peptide/nickel transport system permease protein